MLTQGRLKELLSYDPATGKFTWLVKRNGVKAIGTEAGHPTDIPGKAYWRITIDRVRYRRGPLVWFYMTGEWPHPTVDHRDKDRLNDRWLNLRIATRSQQAMNKSYPPGAAGMKGVLREYNRFNARIMVAGKSHFLGTFATAKEAHTEYLKAATAHHGQFAAHSDKSADG